MVQVLIGVQARSGSKRLPGKSLKIIDDAVMIDHVLASVKKTCGHLNRGRSMTGITAHCALLVPYDDPIKQELNGEIDIIEGSEDDVLSRYKIAMDQFYPDYLVRITGDCPLIVPTIIGKHVTAALSEKLDYCSNAFEDMRTFVDGFDVEVISKRAMQWLFENATDAKDKEHVTTLLRRSAPSWAKFGAVLGFVDVSDIKLSVDTLDDLEEVIKRKKSLDTKHRLARERGYAVFRF